MRSRTKALRNGVVGHDVGIIGPDALGQQHVVQPELLAPLHLGRGDGVERAVGEQRQIARHFQELPRVGVDPDAEFALLAPRHHVHARAGHGDDQIVIVAAGRRIGVLFHRAEQHQLLAGIVRRHGDAVVRHRHDQPLGVRRRRRERSGEHESGDARRESLIPGSPRLANGEGIGGPDHQLDRKADADRRAPEARAAAADVRRGFFGRPARRTARR